MVLSRKDSVCGMFKLVADFSFWVSGHKIEVNGVDEIPREGPVLIVGNHSYWRDPAIAGYIIKENVDRYMNWIVKPSFPKVMENVGVIRMYRKKDMKRKLRELGGPEKEIYKKKVRINNFSAMAEVSRRYSEGEGLFVFGEGYRSPGVINKINMSFVNHAQEFSERRGIEVPLVLFGMDYRNPDFFHTDLVANIERIGWGDNLESRIREGLSRLSGLKLI